MPGRGENGPELRELPEPVRRWVLTRTRRSCEAGESAALRLLLADMMMRMMVVEENRKEMRKSALFLMNAKRFVCAPTVILLHQKKAAKKSHSYTVSIELSKLRDVDEPKFNGTPTVRIDGRPSLKNRSLASCLGVSNSWLDITCTARTTTTEQVPPCGAQLNVCLEV